MAIEDCTHAIELDSQPEFYRDRAVMYFLTFDYENAIADFTQALKLDPDDYASLVHRGVRISTYPGLMKPLRSLPAPLNSSRTILYLSTIAVMHIG